MANGRPFDVLADLGLLTFDVILAAGVGLDAVESRARLACRRLQPIPTI
jgi:hypothetical protein